MQFLVEDVSNPWTLTPSRKLNYRFGLLEGLLNIYGQYPADIVLSVNSQMKHFINEETQQWDGNYPTRMVGWIPFIVETLQKDPDSRRAVIPIYGPPDLNPTSKDICCTLNLQFLLRDGKLNCITTMRSNDALLGTPNDVVQFMLIQKVVAACLGVPTGWYSHRAGSFHIYERDEERIMAVIHDKEKLEKEFPKFPERMNWSDAKSGTVFIMERYRDFLAGKPAAEMNHWFAEPWLSFFKILTKQL